MRNIEGLFKKKFKKSISEVFKKNMFTKSELIWMNQILSNVETTEIKPSYFYRKKVNEELKENKNSVSKELGNLSCKIKYTPKELIDLRVKNVREKQGVANFEGIYIIHNQTQDIFYIGQAQNVFNRAYKHFYIDPEIEKGGRFRVNINYNLPEIYKDYNSGDEFSIRLIPLECTSFSSLDELEYNAISAYDSEYPNGYNRSPGNILNRPIFYNDNYEKVANLILDKIEGTETFSTLSNNRKRTVYICGLFVEFELPNNRGFQNSFVDMLVAYRKSNKNNYLRR